MVGTRNKQKATDTTSESLKSKLSKTNGEASNHISTTPIPKPKVTQTTNPTFGASLLAKSTQMQVTIKINDSNSDKPAKTQEEEKGPF